MSSVYDRGISCVYQEIATIWFPKSNQKLTIPIGMSLWLGEFSWGFSLKEEIQAINGCLREGESVSPGIANPKKNAFSVSQSNIQNFQLWPVKKIFCPFSFFWVEILNPITCPGNVLRWQCVVLTCWLVSCFRLLSRFTEGFSSGN